MFRTRLQFSKTGRARFLSHLDTMRVFQRALTRTRVPVAYSNGYNPHMKLSIAFPLPLGAESVCELLDLQLEHPVGGLSETLNAALPEGFEVLGTRPLFDLNGVICMSYELVFDCEIANIFDGRPLIVQKKTKSGFVDLDIAPHVQNAVCSGCVLNAGLSAQNPTINPSHVLEALRTVTPELEMVKARRLELVSL